MATSSATEPRFYLLRRVFRPRELIIVGVFILELFAFWLAGPRFVSATNMLDAARFGSLVGIAAVGTSMVIILGGIDLSCGALYGLCGCVMALLMSHPVHPVNAWAAAFCALLVGLAFGLLNGACVGYVGIPPFIVTLGTMSMSSGLAMLLTHAEHLPSSLRPFSAAGKAALLKLDTHFFRHEGFSGIHLSVVVMIVVAVLAAFFLVGTRWGRYVHAIGSGEEAARHAGIRVPRIKLFTYAAAGGLAAISGIFYVARFKGINSGVGLGDELNIIAAAVVGGVSLTGGRGSPLGAIVGAMIVKILRDGLVFHEVPESGAKIAVGAFIILAVLVDLILKRLSARRAT